MPHPGSTLGSNQTKLSAWPMVPGDKPGFAQRRPLYVTSPATTSPTSGWSSRRAHFAHEREFLAVVVKMAGARARSVFEKRRVGGAQLAEECDGIDAAELQVDHEAPAPTAREPRRDEMLHHVMRFLHQI